MATYYVGIGGSDASNGQSWANRKLTLNGAEDIPVAAGDTVYVGPGAYRELLTCDINGSSGNQITYIADVTGENTDGVGGIVRITGSDNDTTATRAYTIDFNSADYRTFRGFLLDNATTAIVDVTDGTNCVIEDCSVQSEQLVYGIYVESGSTNLTVRRCIFVSGMAVHFNGTADDRAHVVENCIIFTGDDGVQTQGCGGITVRNCLICAAADGIDITGSLNSGQTMDVNNCIFMCCGSNALEAAASGDIISDYNTFFLTLSADYNNVTAGSNDQTYIPIFNFGPMSQGINMPFEFFGLSEWSPIAAIAGTGEPTEDFYGIVRPTTSAKKSWGPIQYRNVVRETGTTRGSSDASIGFTDAGSHQIFVPVTNTSTTISVYCYRETNYAGTNPRMVIKQPGQSDRTTTDAGSASTWNQLTDTFTPAANPPYVVVELQSLNTATSGSYEAFFDDLDVS